MLSHRTLLQFRNKKDIAVAQTKTLASLINKMTLIMLTSKTLPLPQNKTSVTHLFNTQDAIFAQKQDAGIGQRQDIAGVQS